VRACIEKEDEEAVGCVQVPYASCVSVRTCTREHVCANEREWARVWSSTHALAKTPVANVCAQKKGRKGQRVTEGKKIEEKRRKQKNDTKKKRTSCALASRFLRLISNNSCRRRSWRSCARQRGGGSRGSGRGRERWSVARRA
jgi:hypothetical protein